MSRVWNVESDTTASGGSPAARLFTAAACGLCCILAGSPLEASSRAGPGSPPGASSAPSPPAPTAAAPVVRSWEIESFDVELTVSRDGTLRVAETIRPRFEGSYNGIFRLIPVEYRTPGLGFEYDLRLEVESVTDGEGRELRHEVGKEGHYRKIKIWIPGATDATKTVVIRYSTARALRHSEGDEVTEAYDELY